MKVKINPTFYSPIRRTILEKIPTGDEKENPANEGGISRQVLQHDLQADSTVTRPNPDR
jgi:hypothetical protein